MGRRVACAALLLAAVHAACGLESKGGQHPDAHVDGFVLNSIFVHLERADGRVQTHRRMMQFDDHPHLDPSVAPEQRRTTGGRRGMLPSFDAQTNSRDRVITLAKLNALAYDRQNYRQFQETLYSEPVVSRLIKEGGSVFDANVKQVGDEYDAHETFYNKIVEELEATKAGKIHIAPDGRGMGPSASQSNMKYWPSEQVDEDGYNTKDTAGVAALEFKRWAATNSSAKSVTVIVFRGTATSGDKHNIMNWLHNHVTNSGFTRRMKEMWTNAGLEWTDKMEDRSNEITFFASAGTCIYHNIAGYDANKAPTKSEGDYTLSDDQWKNTGYWEITKAMITKVYEEQHLGKPTNLVDSSGKPVTLADSSLIITGHSQGGTRAALASMYMKKKYNLDIPTVTFAATGAQCIAREFHSDADLLYDVDPYVNHPQITEYTHLLDPWGAGLGYENGNVCSYGKTDIENSEAKKQCEKIWGTPGIKLWFNEGADVIGWKENNAQNRELWLNFANCRYRTHQIETMIIELQKPGVLDANGVTDGGCALAKVADEKDSQNMCSLRDSPCTKHIIYFSIWLGGTVLCICGCCVMCCRMICCRPPPKAPPPPPRPAKYMGPPVPYFRKPVKPPPPPKQPLPPLLPLVDRVLVPALPMPQTAVMAQPMQVQVQMASPVYSPVPTSPITMESMPAEFGVRFLPTEQGHA